MRGDGVAAHIRSNRHRCPSQSFPRLHRPVFDEMEELMLLGLSLEAAVNLAIQKQTGHAVTR